jgi:putative transposase
VVEEKSLPDDKVSVAGTRDWPHAPPHRLKEAGVYFVTARAAGQRHLMALPEMRDWFQQSLLELAKHYGWTLEAWAILSNHYHFIAHSPAPVQNGARSLSRFLQHLHSACTRELNRRDHKPGRTRLWQNFRETHLTLQNAYLARLNYVHQNAVHHKLVSVASQWKWCSDAEFKEAVTPAWLRTVASSSLTGLRKKMANRSGVACVETVDCTQPAAGESVYSITALPS